MKIFNLLQYIHDINENKKIKQDQKLLNQINIQFV